MDIAKKKSIGKILRIVGNTFLWLFVAFSILITILVFSVQGNKTELPNIGGIALVNVVSDSMTGPKGFAKGDLIFDKVIPDREKQDLEVGQVITFYFDINGDGVKEINSHRILERIEGDDGYIYYRTIGDANLAKAKRDFPDMTEEEAIEFAKDKYLVVYTDIRGVWNEHKIVGVGSAIEFLRSKNGFLLVIVLPLVLFFLFELYRFIITLMKVRGKGPMSVEEKEEIKRRAIEEYIRQQEAERVKQDTGKDGSDRES